MFDSLRVIFWQYRRGLALLYLTGLAAAFVALTWYIYFAPPNLDLALTLALRNLAYRDSFYIVEKARLDIEAGRLKDAELRLSRFISSHSNIQRSQLFVHAVTDAVELLSDVYLRLGKPRKALSILDTTVRLTPRSYRVWLVRGRLHQARGMLIDAARDIHEAFKLAPDNPEVTEVYLSVLGDLSDYKRILWVVDQFQRAQARGLPLVFVKVGLLRSTLQRRLLNAVGIPVEHGAYPHLRNMNFYGARRGRRQVLRLPPEIVSEWPGAAGELVVQFLFDNVYEDLVVHAFRYRTEGKGWVEQAITEDNIGYLHRQHSGAEFYAELRTGLPVGKVNAFEIIYSCPSPLLSTHAWNVIDRARRNREALNRQI